MTAAPRLASLRFQRPLLARAGGSLQAAASDSLGGRTTPAGSGDVNDGPSLGTAPREPTVSAAAVGSSGRSSITTSSLSASSSSCSLVSGFLTEPGACDEPLAQPGAEISAGQPGSSR
eukprot:3602489-Pyramimonas_sp.AAC.1